MFIQSLLTLHSQMEWSSIWNKRKLYMKWKEWFQLNMNLELKNSPFKAFLNISVAVSLLPLEFKTHCNEKIEESWIRMTVASIFFHSVYFHGNDEYS